MMAFWSRSHSAARNFQTGYSRYADDFIRVVRFNYLADFVHRDCELDRSLQRWLTPLNLSQYLGKKKSVLGPAC